MSRHCQGVSPSGGRLPWRLGPLVVVRDPQRRQECSVKLSWPSLSGQHLPEAGMGVGWVWASGPRVQTQISISKITRSLSGRALGNVLFGGLNFRVGVIIPPRSHSLLSSGIYYRNPVLRQTSPPQQAATRATDRWVISIVSQTRAL